MIAVIAEKPSVARAIGAIVGATNREDGYLSGNRHLVTWAFGHLVGLAMPEAYGIQNFNRDGLPIVPEVFQLIPRQVKTDKGYQSDPGVLKQLKIIKDVFQQCEQIIVATDAGREGELIFRYIYQYLECRKPFVRLWINSLTDKGIKEGLNNLQPGHAYDPLYFAAKARSEADWLIGINASQALSVAAGRGAFSLGRVQTPTLAMICNRFLENKKFTPQKYWQLKLQTQKGTISFAALSADRYATQQDAATTQQYVKNSGQIAVKTVERKEVNQEPPLLFDLTTLQKEANTKLDFSADKTLAIAQKLYESGIISYPRTGSRYISQDVFEEIPERIANLEQYPRFTGYAAGMKGKVLDPRAVNDNKVTDHHALIITENLPGELGTEERAIYELIAGRMLEAFSDKCVKEVTCVVLSSGNTDFSVKGAVIKSAGWRAVLREPEEEEENTTLPTLQQGEILVLSDVELKEKQTKPKPLHTESSLLSSMESAGRELENEEERAAMKESGIGTPATRAAIIETLFARDYIRREKKSLLPTEKGLAVFEIIRTKKLADVQMTGMWENALSKIETGEVQADSFRKGIEVYAAQITAELLATPIQINDNSPVCNCPKCKTGRMQFYSKVVKCGHPDCGLIVFRNKSEKQLTEKQLTELLTTGKTGLIKGFKSKAGKSFDAAITFDEQYRTIFVFPPKTLTHKR